MIQYPRIPHDKKKSVKLTLSDIKIIQDIFIRSPLTSMRKGAMTFGVSPLTIKYWVDPLYKAWQIEKTDKRKMWRYYNEPGFKEKIKLRVRYWILTRSRTDPIFREYMKQMTKYCSENKTSRTKYIEGFSSFMRMVEQ